MAIKIAYSGLSLYPKPEGAPFSRDDRPVTSPFRITIEGLIGGCLVKRCYLRNDDPALYFTNITVRFADELGLYSSGNSANDWSRKLIYSIHEPFPEEWEQVENHNSLTFSSIGSTSLADTFSFFPIWVRCSIPAGLREQNITTLPLCVEGTQKLVGY
jgi:hypothetical protein